MIFRSKLLVAGIAVIFSLAAAAVLAADKPAPTPGKGFPTAGKEMKMESKAQKGSGEDANIKVPQKPNEEKGSGIEAPPSKGGPKTRSVPGWLVVDNRTQWYINIYRNGYYQGTVGPWGDMYVWANIGDMLYGRADFDNGTYTSWGPDRMNALTCRWYLWP